MRLDDGIEIKEKEGEREKMHLKGCSRLGMLKLLLLRSPGGRSEGEQLKPKRHQSDELSCYSSTFTSFIHTHTDKSEKYPSHGILKNAKSWGNRQIICGIVIKLNASSPLPAAHLCCLSCNAWLSLIFFLLSAFMASKCSKSVQERTENRERDDKGKPFRKINRLPGQRPNWMGSNFRWAAKLSYN